MSKANKIYVQLPRFIGYENVYYITNSTVVPSDKPRFDMYKPPHPNPTFLFDTMEDGYAFIKYLSSDFARFCISFFKCSKHLDNGELAIVPWMETIEMSEELQAYMKQFLGRSY